MTKKWWRFCLHECEPVATHFWTIPCPPFSPWSIFHCDWFVADPWIRTHYDKPNYSSWARANYSEACKGEIIMVAIHSNFQLLLLLLMIMMHWFEQQHVQSCSWSYDNFSRSTLIDCQRVYLVSYPFRIITIWEF